jgi:hypothetical protein
MTGCMGYLYQENVRQRAKLSLYHTINATYGNLPRADLLWETWKQMQIDVSLLAIQHSGKWSFQLKCCGATSYEDWFYYPSWPRKQFVPDRFLIKLKIGTPESSSNFKSINVYSCCNQEKFNMSYPNSTLHCGKSMANHYLLYQQVFPNLPKKWNPI